MRLIDADELVDILYDTEFATRFPLDEVSGAIDTCPTIKAVPIFALLDLRDSLCKTDRISIFGLTMLNQLIAKYDNVLVNRITSAGRRGT